MPHSVSAAADALPSVPVSQEQRRLLSFFLLSGCSDKRGDKENGKYGRRRIFSDRRGNLRRRGLVYGAGYTQMTLCHKAAQTEEELRELFGSKYVQSRLGDTFLKIRRQLMETGSFFLPELPARFTV